MIRTFVLSGRRWLSHQCNNFSPIAQHFHESRLCLLQFCRLYGVVFYAHGKLRKSNPQTICGSPLTTRTPRMEVPLGDSITPFAVGNAFGL
jgi:hypothetical protein